MELQVNVFQGESEQAFKKQCNANTIATKKTKQKSIQPKDPQSIAAKVHYINDFFYQPVFS